MTEQILSRPASADPAPRGAPRHRGDQDVSCYALSDAGLRQYPARLKDISLNGLALVVSEPVRRQMTLGVEFECPEGRLTYLLVGQVVRTVPHQGGWLVGCAFDRPLGEDELNNLL